VAAVEKDSPALGPVLKQAELVALGEAEVRLRFAQGSSYPQLLERRRAGVEKVLSGFLGRPVRLVVEVGPAAETGAAPGTSIAAAERAEKEARSSERQAAARNHPNIQEAARLLGADIDGTDEL
jgi:hypothetical protein